FRLTIQWTPGHVGVEGDEKADELAKRAAEGEYTPLTDPNSCLSHPLPSSHAAMVAAFTKHTRTSWAKEWNSSSQDRHLKRFDTGLPSSSFYKLYD
ncbi:hypothetical protein BT96DRAFT_760761, partial [Gymnopus androsaceus JB14]